MSLAMCRSCQILARKGRPRRGRWSAGCGQGSLDQLDDLGRIRLNCRAKAVNDACASDEELLEVPLHLAGLAPGILRLGQLGVEGVLGASVHPDLLEHGERDGVLLRAELLDGLGAAELLQELVARETQHREA